jgi:hypothetical protein
MTSLFLYIDGNRTSFALLRLAALPSLPWCNRRPLRFVFLAVSSTGRARNLTHHPLQKSTNLYGWCFFLLWQPFLFTIYLKFSFEKCIMLL